MVCINHRIAVAALSINVACVLMAKPTSAENDPAIASAVAKVEKLWDDGFFTEGAAVGPDGRIYFVDYPFDEHRGES